VIEYCILQQDEGKVTFGRIDCDREGTVFVAAKLQSSIDRGVIVLSPFVDYMTAKGIEQVCRST